MSERRSSIPNFTELLEQEYKHQAEKKEEARKKKAAKDKARRDSQPPQEKNQVHQQRSHRRRVQALVESIMSSPTPTKKRGAEDLQKLLDENAKKRQQRWNALTESNKAVADSDKAMAESNKAVTESNRRLHEESERQAKAEEVEFEATVFLVKQSVDSSTVATPKADPLATPATAAGAKIATISTPSKNETKRRLFDDGKEWMEPLDEENPLADCNIVEESPKNAKSILFVSDELQKLDQKSQFTEITLPGNIVQIVSICDCTVVLTEDGDVVPASYRAKTGWFGSASVVTTDFTPLKLPKDPIFGIQASGTTLLVVGQSNLYTAVYKGNGQFDEDCRTFQSDVNADCALVKGMIVGFNNDIPKKNYAAKLRTVSLDGGKDGGDTVISDSLALPCSRTDAKIANGATSFFVLASAMKKGELTKKLYIEDHESKKLVKCVKFNEGTLDDVAANSNRCYVATTDGRIASASVTDRFKEWEIFGMDVTARFIVAGTDFCLAAVDTTASGDADSVVILQELKGKSGDGDGGSHTQFLFDTAKSSAGKIKKVLLVSGSDHAAFVATVEKEEETHFRKAG
mmetsp:Transcript_44414/g.107438  ORF Transcript_44414/g.107438 Transcript_44414/m.107438 type:complete len:575 (-) Transcript_44414:327-2051(-)